MSSANRSALYNVNISEPILQHLNLNAINYPSPSPKETTEKKVAPLGPSPENVVAYQIKSSIQELEEGLSSSTERSY